MSASDILADSAIISQILAGFAGQGERSGDVPKALHTEGEAYGTEGFGG